MSHATNPTVDITGKTGSLSLDVTVTHAPEVTDRQGVIFRPTTCTFYYELCHDTWTPVLANLTGPYVRANGTLGTRRPYKTAMNLVCTNEDENAYAAPNWLVRIAAEHAPADPDGRHSQVLLAAEKAQAMRRTADTAFTSPDPTKSLDGPGWKE